MDKYKNFINEALRINGGKFVNTDNNDYAVERLKHLVELVQPLLKESRQIYPQVKKWKRCTKLTTELNTVWLKVFKVIPSMATNTANNNDDLVVNQNYRYEPDVNVLPNYVQAYNRKVLKLTKIGDNQNSQYTDSKIKAKECRYQVEYYFPYKGKYYFWTRKECLKKIR